VWFIILQKVGLQDLSPHPEDISFEDWWASTNSGIDGQARKGLNSLIILRAWSIWNHRNRCVFDGIQPRLNGVLAMVRDELHLWSLAGARGVSHLLALGPAKISPTGQGSGLCLERVSLYFVECVEVCLVL
jgi:hypothetical protein